MAVLKNDGVDGIIAHPTKEAVLRATGAITAGDCVLIDTGASAALKSEYGEEFLVKSSDADDSPLAVGIALETVSAPAAGSTVEVKVRTAGFIDTPTGVGIIALGAQVGSSATTGNIKTAAAPTAALAPFAICLDAYTAGNADGKILIIDKGLYG